MASSSRSGRPEDELFMQQSASTAETPTVGPLRITKQDSRTSTSPTAQNPSAAQAPSSTSPPPQTYPKPTTSPPTGPLPYPDNGPRPYASPASSSSPNATGAQGYPYPTAPYGPYDSSSTSPRLGERRGNVPKPLDGSSSPEINYTQDISQRLPQQLNGSQPLAAPPPPPPPPAPTHLSVSSDANNEPEPLSAGTEFAHRYYPQPQSLRPTAPGTTGTDPYGVSRLASSASVSTTRASRGSPPPPETPQAELPLGGGIEARYAAAGIAGPSTLSSLQAQSLASQQARNQLSPNAHAGAVPDPSQRPWTPTEDPTANTHGPALAYQGNEQASNAAAGVAAAGTSAATTAPGGPALNAPKRSNTLENDMQGLQVSEEPPPAYSSLAHVAQGYPDEKGRVAPTAGVASTTSTGVPAANRATGAAAVVPTPADQTPTTAQPTGGLPLASQAAATQPAATQSATQPTATEPLSAATVSLPAAHNSHPAFANDPNQVSQQQATPPNQTAGLAGSTSPGPGPSSPPPLPEGWIAHMDPNSGQYYYIHLPTQSTQWEFPKGPNPLNLNDAAPVSPTGSIVHPFASPTVTTFTGKPGLQSPGVPPQKLNYHDNMMNMAAVSSPTAAGFSQVPPTSGVDQYRVAPTNGVYFGPYLRYTNMDLENGIWFGSIMLVSDAPHPPTIHIHQSSDLSPNPRQLKPNFIYQHQRWMFYRYDIDLRMDEQDAKWTYAITSHLGCTRYEFVIAGRNETSWRFIAHSGNDFALNVNANERNKIGGVGAMWKDILQKHQEVGGFHAQLGMGNLIFADRLWKDLPLLKQWTAISGKENRKNAQWTSQHEEDVKHAYFHFYTSHLDQPLLREAFAQIPHVLALDDHDIFDGYGSYPEYMQSSNIVKNIGRIGIEMYHLFQHHTTNEILNSVRDDLDLFTITRSGWHFIKYFGPAVVVVGPDCRSERTQTQVMDGRTYQGLFPKIAMLPPCVQHCIWMIPVPIIYPRLEAAEQFANTFATGKKVATGTFNALGKVTSSVAGIVGAKGVVGEGFNSVKKAVGKSGLMSSVLSPFGEIDLLDELRDQWTHESKDLERTYLIRTLQGISHNKSLRMTFFSGASNCCGAGLVHDPSSPANHKTMYQIISSSVVNAPPSSYVLRMLHPSSATQAPLYIPQNGTKSQRNSTTTTDTKEDMLEIFGQDVNGQPRELKRLMGRRNYAVVLSYDPETVHGAFGQSAVSGKPSKGPGTISLAVDFMVQADTGGFAPVGAVKYGPIIIPSLEYGR